MSKGNPAREQAHRRLTAKQLRAALWVAGEGHVTAEKKKEFAK